MKRIFVILFPILLLIDQLSKYTIRHQGGFYICNKGVAFGISLITIAIGIMLLIFSLLVYNLKFKVLNFKSISNFKFQISNLSTTSIIYIHLIISGGISNLIDRFYFGCVIDFIDLKFWPVFNIADIYITIGGITLIYLYVFQGSFRRRHRP